MVNNSLLCDHIIHGGEGERVDLLHDGVGLLFGVLPTILSLAAKLVVVGVIRIRITSLDIFLPDAQSLHTVNSKRFKILKVILTRRTVIFAFKSKKLRK